MTEFLHGLIAEYEMPKGRELISVEQIKNLFSPPRKIQQNQEPPENLDEPQHKPTLAFDEVDEGEREDVIRFALRLHLFPICNQAAGSRTRALAD